MCPSLRRTRELLSKLVTSLNRANGAGPGLSRVSLLSRFICLFSAVSGWSWRLAYTLNTFIASSPRWLMTLTAMRPEAGRGKGPGGVAVERGPGVEVDLRLQRRLERLVGVVRAQEVGVADEEALLVVVGVDEPAGDAVGAVAPHLAGVGVEDVHAANSDLGIVDSDQWRADSDFISA